MTKKDTDKFRAAVEEFEIELNRLNTELGEKDEEIRRLREELVEVLQRESGVRVRKIPRKKEDDCESCQ